jgi:uncharacterized protein (DUF885 family)
MNPEWATQLGDHRFDHKLFDYSIESIRKVLLMNRYYLDSLHAIDITRLNDVNKIDFQIMKSNIRYAIFEIDTLREYEWNPLFYNMGSALNALVARDFAPLEKRLISLKERLKAIPEVLNHARSNLKNPHKMYTETAILQNKGIISLVRNDLNQFINQVPGLKDEFIVIQKNTVEALKEYGEWLEKELLAKSKGEFRIGSDKYVKKLNYVLESNLAKEDILKRAEQELKTTQHELYTTSVPLYEKLFSGKAEEKDKKTVIKSVLDKLAEMRPNNETIVDQAKDYLKECTDFVRHMDLVSLPEEPVKVIVMPEFARGLYVAYCDAPGPLEAMGETFFAISPAPASWNEEQVTSLFKEYNNYMLQNLTIHEAMPGHYLQLAHANKFKAPTNIRMIFESGTFIEGWATYSEQLMVEKGYGGPEVKMQQLKMRLRLIINAIIDPKIHTENMQKQEAMDLMIKEGFQEEGEAAGKWRRACLSSTQLSTYFVGNIEVNDLRNDYEEKMGSRFDLKEFHDNMLSYGSIAPKYLRQLLVD